MDPTHVTDVAALLENVGSTGVVVLAFAWLGRRFIDQQLQQTNAMLDAVRKLAQSIEHHETRAESRHEALVRELRRLTETTTR